MSASLRRDGSPAASLHPRSEARDAPVPCIVLDTLRKQNEVFQWAAPAMSLFRLFAGPLMLFLALASVPARAAGPIDCELRFSMSGWSVFYKHATGIGTVTCDNGQSMKVRISAKGGGLTFGKSSIENGLGKFTEVHAIGDVIGGYAAAEAHAGASKSASARVVTKGPISLALSGKGRGWDGGVAFGNFIISRR